MQDQAQLKILLLLVATGGAAGSVLRFGIAKVMQGFGWSHWPWPTLTANLLGSLLAGFLAGYLIKFDNESPIRYFLITGFCGGFTTFSAFGLENAHLLSEGRVWEAFLYTCLSLVFGIGMVFVGIWLGKLS